MNQYERKVDEFIQENGGVLVRSKRHRVFRFPGGQVFVTASTPSGQRAALNQLSDLRNRLGLSGHGKGEGERREPKRKLYTQEKPLNITPSLNTAMAEKIALSGLLKESLEGEINFLRMQLEATEDALAEALQPSMCLCWWCRIKRRLRTSAVPCSVGGTKAAD